MLYAMVFDELNIPYKVKASSNHVYLVANPGPKSIVVKTTNPDFEKKYSQEILNNNMPITSEIPS